MLGGCYDHSPRDAAAPCAASCTCCAMLGLVGQTCQGMSHQVHDMSGWRQELTACIGLAGTQDAQGHTMARKTSP